MWWGIIAVLFISLVQLSSAAADSYIKCLGVGKTLDEIIEACGSVVIDPSQPKERIAAAYYLRGDAFTKKANWTAAIEDFTESLRRDPIQIDAYYRRGRAYLATSADDEALDDFEHVLKLRQSVAETHAGMAIAYYRKASLDFTREGDENLRLAFARLEDAKKLGIGKSGTCEIIYNGCLTLTEIGNRKKLQEQIEVNAAAIFRSPSDMVIGNHQGDVTIVEFFDYNCSYCKKTASDVMDLIVRDPKIKVILKPLGILSKDSDEVALLALASHKQGKFVEMHMGLLGLKHFANAESALKVGAGLGLDTEKLKKDAKSAAIVRELATVSKLANKIGVRGTPTFLIGDKVVIGAPESAAEVLGKAVAAIRETGCKVC